MSKLLDIAAAQRQQEIAKSDFNSMKVYNGSVLVHDDTGSATDVATRTSEIAKNDYNSLKPYTSSDTN